MKSKGFIISGIIKLTLIFWFIAIAFYYIGGEELKSKSYSQEAAIGDALTGELLAGDVIEQEFISPIDTISSIAIYTGTYDRVNTGDVIIRILNSERRSITETKVDISSIPNNALFNVMFDKPISGIKNKTLFFQIESLNGIHGNAITLWYSSANQAGQSNLSVNGNQVNGNLNLSIYGRINFEYAAYYWIYAITLYLVLVIYSLVLINKNKKGQKNIILNLAKDIKKYQFLIRQLVSREFKTKYKRSALGMFWSVLNPLLTMFVQYIVFSTLFKTDVPNYPVYLLTGIVLFNFFQEAILTSLQSIVNNASLVTKVYVPKYIYPITKILSAVVNLLLSLIPLLIVIIITQTPITKAIFLLPFGLICLTVFSIGLGLILASAMVFFRDTQFLWGIASMLWMYSTPIFYPENIIPHKFILVLKLNPLYHFIRFVRITILQGVSPEPKAYLACMVFSLLSLAAGCYVFKKAQNKFILYI